MPYMHKDKDGNLLPLADLELSHLKNIIALLNRRAKEGVLVEYGGGGCMGDIYYDSDVVFGDEALRRLNHQRYVDELNRRQKVKG